MTLTTTKTPDSPSETNKTWLAWLLGSYTMLGPFSISTYMPFFPMLMVSLGASQVELQQTLSLYLAAFGFMMLLHGPLSDAFGRRPVILGGLTVYMLASLGGAVAGSLGFLLFCRTLQGLSVGAGSVVGRVVIRDRLAGPEAQKLLSQVTMIFGLAPAIAPVFGGWLQHWFSWQSVFIFMALFSGLQLVASYISLPETLAREQRTSMKPAALLRSYGTVLKSKGFWLLSLALSCNFIGFFLYVSAAPVFVTEYLGLSKAQFGWLFIPATAGIILGAFLSGKVAKQMAPEKTISLGFVTMFVAVGFNLAYNAFLPPVVPWVVLPVMLYTAGMAFATPALTLRTLDLFGSMRGMAASVQGFVQTMVMTFVSAIAAPLVGDSGLKMALCVLIFLAAGYAAWFAHMRRPSS